jgi:hypothetical protein
MSYRIEALDEHVSWRTGQTRPGRMDAESRHRTGRRTRAGSSWTGTSSSDLANVPFNNICSVPFPLHKTLFDNACSDSTENAVHAYQSTATSKEDIIAHLLSLVPGAGAIPLTISNAGATCTAAKTS